jgi:hypothetical protein
MNAKEIIYTVISQHIKKEEKTIAQIAIEICEALDICECCGKKKGRG